MDAARVRGLFVERVSSVREGIVVKRQGVERTVEMHEARANCFNLLSNVDV